MESTSFKLPVLIINEMIMKKIFTSLFTGIFWISMSNAQSVAINTDGAAAGPSSLLDVQSMNKGILIPRMKVTERFAITSPASGLMVYQTDGNSCFYYYTGAAWTRVGNGISMANGGNAGVFLVKSANA